MTPTPTPSQATARPQPWRLLVLVLLALSLVAASAWLIVVALDRTDSESGPVRLSSKQSTADQQVREDVMNATRQFVLRTGTYGPEDLDKDGKLTAYRERVAEVITTSFATEFEKAVTVPEQLVAQFAQKRKADVYAVGVVAFDSDSATALVAGALTDTFGKAQPDEPRQFRWEVELVKIDGTWLIDNYTPVGGGTDPATEPTGPSEPSGAPAPSATPTPTEEETP